jgi:hypothetical protein
MKLKYDTSTVGGKLDVYKEFLTTEKAPLFKYKSEKEWSELESGRPSWDWNRLDYNYAEPEVPEIIPWTYKTCPKAPMALKWPTGLVIYFVVNIEISP